MVGNLAANSKPKTKFRDKISEGLRKKEKNSEGLRKIGGEWKGCVNLGRPRGIKTDFLE